MTHDLHRPIGPGSFNIGNFNGLFGDATPVLLLAKAIGALAGSLVSLAYIMPRGRREAAIRLLVGLVTGLVFGGTAGVKIADMMDLLGKVSVFEITLMGATLSSLCAWWGLGVLRRMADRWPVFAGHHMPNSSDKKDDLT